MNSYYKNNRGLSSEALARVAQATLAGRQEEARMSTTAQEGGYQGWSNYETWAVSLWMDNDRDLYQLVKEAVQDSGGDAIALADSLRSAIEESMPQLDGLAGDLLTGAISEVNWDEIATNLVEEDDSTSQNSGVESGWSE